MQRTALIPALAAVGKGSWEAAESGFTQAVKLCSSPKEAQLIGGQVKVGLERADVEALLDQLAVHDRDLTRRPAKGNKTELQPEPKRLAERYKPRRCRRFAARVCHGRNYRTFAVRK